MKIIRDEKEPGNVPQQRLLKPFRSRDRMKDILKSIFSLHYSVFSVPSSSPFLSDSPASVWKCRCSSSNQRIKASYRSEIYDMYSHEFCFRGCCCVEEREQLAFSQVRLILKNAQRMQQKNMTENQKVSRKEKESEGSKKLNNLYTGYGYHDSRLVTLTSDSLPNVPVRSKYSVIFSSTKRDTFESQLGRRVDDESDNTIIHSIMTFTPGTSSVTSRNLPPFEVCRHLRYVPSARKSICTKSFTYIVHFAISMENTQISWGCQYCLADFTLFFSNGRLRCSYWNEVDWEGREIFTYDMPRQPNDFGGRYFSTERAEWDRSKFSDVAIKYDELVTRQEVK